MALGFVEKSQSKEKRDISQADHEESLLDSATAPSGTAIRANGYLETADEIDRRLKEIVSTRRSRGYVEQVEELTSLTRKAKTPAQKLHILLCVISTQCGVSVQFQGPMPIKMWKQCVGNMLHVLDILNKYPNIDVNAIEAPLALVTFLERLHREYVTILRFTNPYTIDYVNRLRDEPLFMVVAQNLQCYLEQTGEFKLAAKVALHRLEFVYHMPQEVYESMLKMVEQNTAYGKLETETQEESRDQHDYVKIPESVPRRPTFPESSRDLVVPCLSLIYNYGDEHSKDRAMMCSIYHFSISDEYYVARDMLLVNNLLNRIHLMDIETQILFNRALAQLGLCAFRAGEIVAAHYLLSGLHQSGRIKEHLAQGIHRSRYSKKTPEQEEFERQHLMPFHMHINLNLLDSTHLICAMLLEVPWMASPCYNSWVPCNETFFHIFRISRLQVCTVAPRNVHDHIIIATGALIRGDYRKAFETIAALETWKLLHNKEQVLHMLKIKMKEAALRTYIHTFPGGCVSLNQLTTMFDLPVSEVHGIVNIMIMFEGLQARWNEPASYLIFHYILERELQRSISHSAYKQSPLVDSNEWDYETS